MTEHGFEPGSFRDRNARVFHGHDAVYRSLNVRALEEWECLSATRFFQRFQTDGRIVRTERADVDVRPPAGGSPWAAVLKHEVIPFVSYPFEWTFGMLRAAALLHLELLGAALDEGLILKDSSPFNVQWRGTTPVFIDIASFERLGAGEPWTGYRQFCQLFLYPLMLQSYKGLPFQPWLRGSLDGITPEHCRQIMSMRDCMRPGVLTHVYLQAKAASACAATDRDLKADLHQAGFNSALIKANVKSLTKLVRSLSHTPKGSGWLDYATENSYEAADANAKLDVVRRAVVAERPGLVWDLGCNTGTFSKLAAGTARYVISLDADPAVIERLYQDLEDDGISNILPLISNLADPSPNLGWRGLERRSLERRGAPDLTLALALLHHLVITANIPLEDVIGWLGELGGSIVIEWVGRDDPMVKRLLRHKEERYEDYDESALQRALESSFHIVTRQPLPSGRRVLYYARPRVSRARHGATSA